MYMIHLECYHDHNHNLYVCTTVKFLWYEFVQALVLHEQFCIRINSYDLLLKSRDGRIRTGTMSSFQTRRLILLVHTPIMHVSRCAHTPAKVDLTLWQDWDSKGIEPKFRQEICQYLSSHANCCSLEEELNLCLLDVRAMPPCDQERSGFEPEKRNRLIAVLPLHYLGTSAPPRNWTESSGFSDQRADPPTLEKQINRVVSTRRGSRLPDTSDQRKVRDSNPYYSFGVNSFSKRTQPTVSAYFPICPRQDSNPH